jgi:hypothetical protein
LGKRLSVIGFIKTENTGWVKFFNIGNPIRGCIYGATPIAQLDNVTSIYKTVYLADFFERLDAW